MTDHIDTAFPRNKPIWSVEVKEFGRIASAKVEMAPLVVLLGKNNTGKSYLASLLWSILNFEEFYLTRNLTNDKLPDWYRDFSSNKDIEYDEEFILEKGVFTSFVNELISARKDDVAERVLSLKGATVSKIEISLKDSAPELVFLRSPWEDDNNALASYSLSVGDSIEFNLSINPEQDFSTFAARSLSSACDGILNGNFHGAPAAYLPAARTGLMLAYRSLISGAFEALGLDKKPNADRLPLPTVRFLQSLNKSEPENGTSFDSVADFLEEQILQGKIVKGNSETDPSFLYHANSRTILPLYATSSMITELAPFLILLRNNNLGGGLVFEEPEAHLHLSAQRCMARAIVRLVNMGVPIVITTHSDTFVQELNLLMQMNKHHQKDELKRKYGYSDDEILSSEDVRAYEFIVEKNKSFVVPAEINEYGIVSHSLNEALHDLADEIVDIQSSMERSDD